jgi:hypothetical protein
MKRKISAAVLPAAVGACCLTLLGAAPAEAAPTAAELPASVVVLEPMVSYKSESAPWPAAADRTAAERAAAKLAAVRVALPAQSADQRRAALDAAGKKADAKWKAALRPTRTTNKTARVYGSCGWSEVTLSNATGDNLGYAGSRFVLNRPGYAYRVNVHVWDTAAFDFSNWDFPDTGNLNGGTSYSDYFTFRVDENGYYGAQLNRGDVYVGGVNWCSTGKPRVDDVHII